ncbi:hypothetical protein OHAE_40 [Ochrobactrum soli]|uniref:Uncharacterized protein n=1 Tax=Ochrobactrum soli TaxID=2448455 RepID=A0A2P9HJM1_9HYPH|nr:hypothetical protein OHAE_40 [[Ochrobactrum] soli]
MGRRPGTRPHLTHDGNPSGQLSALACWRIAGPSLLFHLTISKGRSKSAPHRTQKGTGAIILSKTASAVSENCSKTGAAFVMC